ncbi:restriction endonuclease subunit S [Lactobacillus sp. ESL0681]|uniref:restriction endonuclease subunit S n=1 Tax=Lactobacillus sp. ESL0681 TaxID=2983211 RepID=UPI0023F99FE9|nr:restriction endonuclease subunit S [Lactobacillus sp. ESL0681]WEV40697.1 restriction endonuclease subunit S [Lactobacillus sp. ESL0681]
MRELSINDIGIITTGGTPKKSQKGAFGDYINFLTPRDMNGDRFSDSTERMLSKNGSKQLYTKKVSSPSISVSCIGSDMGKTIFNRLDIITNQQINSISKIVNGVDPYYLYYNLLTKKHYLKNLGSGQGSTMPILNKKQFSKIMLCFPELKIQRKIVKPLKILDNKIELNNRINDNLAA